MLSNEISRLFPEPREHNSILEYDEKLVKKILETHNKKKNAGGFKSGTNELGNCYPFFMGCLRNEAEKQSGMDENGEITGETLIECNLNIYSKLSRTSQIQRLKECWGLISEDIKRLLRLNALTTLHYQKRRWEHPELQKLLDSMPKYGYPEGSPEQIAVKKKFKKLYDESESKARREAQMIMLWTYMRDNNLKMHHLTKQDDYDDIPI